MTPHVTDNASFGLDIAIPTGRTTVLGPTPHTHEHCVAFCTSALPIGGLVRDDTGTLYGTTAAGGAHGWGVVYQLSAAGSYTVRHSFARTEGAWPEGALLRDSAGTLVGTTVGGGTYRKGVVYQLSTADDFTVLHQFRGFAGGPDAAYPYGELVRDSADMLYGTTAYGGASGQGVVFQTPAP